MADAVTALDLAHAGDDDTDAARLRFFAALADTELFVLLERAVDGDQIAPRVFPVQGQTIIMAFDTEARLADFADSVAPYAALPGRVLAGMLAGQGLGLGVNLGVAPSSTLLDPQALDWLQQMLSQDGAQSWEARIRAVSSPNHVPNIVLDALGARFANAGAVAEAAYLVHAAYEDHTVGHLLVITGASERAEPALARAVSEALSFSGLDAGFLDVAFVGPADKLAERVRPVALRLDFPKPQAPVIKQPQAPGSDPDKPPRLH